ncbi:M56 family metallopeptidase [Chitinophaga niabensis]|uniref:Signal transducer regulating beta-lactamase production, contains metallopeptidase domain n=1 Tax=Chitinophaga niabensis TaxID=536979 RepID=A0A1N6H4D3_9BACT|nr:M56 family metallopeptidase [Chitinophaga niabensis]SIO14616.1 Signal transducer regulating beta-lactamase production, contains metallopeptidase domain [Chitinophaga niabensis]
MFLTNETLQAICRTFLHSIWQGMIAAALAGIILWGTRHSSARTRYNLLGLLLLLSFLTSGITLYTELGNTAAAIANTPGTDIDATTAVLPLHPGQMIIQYMNEHTPWFMMAWALIFLVKCIRLTTGFYYIHRIRRINTGPVPAHWEETLIKLSHSLGIQKAVRLLESGIVKTPVTIGFFKPVIFLPLGLLAQLPADQVETILLHELAHIRRKDYLVNILHSFTETIFFFNPAFLWISARLREEREACCDDIVVEHTPHKATYLHALVAFEEQAVAGTSLQLRLGNTKDHLLQRVKRMLTRENKKLTIMERISLIFGLIAITAFSFMPEKELAKAAPVSPHSAGSLVYYVPTPVQAADTPKPKKDKWVSKPAPKKRLTSTDTVLFKKPVWKDKYVTDTVRFATLKYKDKYATDTVRLVTFKSRDKYVTDTVRFSKPVLKKKLASTDTVYFNQPIPKKKRFTTTDTVLFKKPVPKKSAKPAESSLFLKKKWTELPPERQTEKKKLFVLAETKLSASGDQPRTKKAPPALKPADKDIKKKKEEETQLRSKFFGDYLPEGIREKVNPKEKNC